MSAGALLQKPLGELTALPQPLSGFKGPNSKVKEGEGREGKSKRGEGRRRDRADHIPPLAPSQLDTPEKKSFPCPWLAAQ